MNNRRDALGLFIGAIAFGAIKGGAANAEALSGEALQGAVRRASAAINALGRIEGGFIQTNPNQTSNSGKFWLSRPGKMRFEYDAPSPLLLVCDGSDVIIVDKRLRTTERYPLRSTPLYFLLKPNVNLSTEVSVTSAQTLNGKLILTVRDRRREADGELRLIFSRNMQLEEWAIKDRQNRTTTVRLANILQSNSSPPSRFSVPLPKTKRGKQ